jgi:hypothetical protein
MPTLDGKKYSYDKEGVKSYIKALKKKRKKKMKPRAQRVKKINNPDPYPYSDPEGESGTTSGPGGE